MPGNYYNIMWSHYWVIGLTLIHVYIGVSNMCTCTDYYCFIAFHTQNGFTPLHVASQEGHKKVVELLLIEKAYIDRQDKV